MRGQKANGIKLIEGTDSSYKARELISHCGYDSNVNVHTPQKLKVCILDESQARKTGSEKEIVLVHPVKDGRPLYFTVAMQDMDAYRW